MNELLTMTHGGNDAAGISARITREVGILAARLANFLASSLPRAEGALAEGQAFLRAMYELVCEGRPLSAWSRHPLERKPLGAPHPLDRLAESLELTPIEIELLLFAGLGEEHEGLAAILRSLHPRNEPRTTVGLAAQLFLPDQSCRPAFREVMEMSAVVKSGALGLIGDGPFYEHSLQLADSLWSALHGLDVWPAAVTRLDGPNATTGLDEWFDTIPVRRAIKAIQQRRKCAVVVTADNEETAFHRARAMVAQAGAEPAGILLPPSLEAGLEKLIQIHALARGVVPVLKPASADAAAASDSQSFAAFPEVVVWCGRFGSAGASGQRPFIVVPTERLTPAARRRMWLEVIPSLAAQSKTLASRYCVEPSTATAVAADLRLIAELEGREPTVQDVGASLRARGSASFSGGVKLIRPRATWDELILAADRLKQLREATSRLEQQVRVFDEWGFLRNRAGARGVRLLFAGPPGTGKTLSAEVLAHALGVDLMVVDLSRVVSKWIGETEKNLSAVFDAAERAQAALFFDEADALFGKRTEVTDAHDRYANLETAYLLTRLEQFEGLSIMATNLRENIDPAFMRRLEFVIDFEEPDCEERLSLWRCHLPEDAPLAGDVNLREMAALYPVVGAVIRNAAVAAAFLAADEDGVIHRRHFIHAIRREYEKTGRSFPGMPIGMAVR